MNSIVAIKVMLNTLMYIDVIINQLWVFLNQLKKQVHGLPRSFFRKSIIAWVLLISGHQGNIFFGVGQLHLPKGGNNSFYHLIMH